MNNQSITLMQLYFILTLSTGLLAHVFIIPILIGVSGRDSWISGILSTLAVCLLLLLFYYVMKVSKKENISAWIEKQFSPFFRYLFTIPMTILLFLIAFITVKDTIIWSTDSFLPRTPQIVSALLLLIVCFLTALVGIKSIAILSGILLPVVLFLGYFVGFVNMKEKEYRFLLPVLEDGLQPVLLGSLYMFGVFAELIMIILLQHQVKNRISRKSIYIFTFFLLYLTIGPLIGGLTEFGVYESKLMRYPSFAQWRLAYIGNYIAHLDFFAVYQWLSGAFIRTALMIYLIPEIHLMTGKKRVWAISIIFILLIVFVSFPISDSTILSIFEKYYLPLQFMTVFLIILYLFTLSLIVSKRKGAKRNEAF